MEAMSQCLDRAVFFHQWCEQQSRETVNLLPSGDTQVQVLPDGPILFYESMSDTNSIIACFLGELLTMLP